MWRGLLALWAGMVALAAAAPAAAAEEPDYALIRTAGKIEIRDYPALVTATTVEPGARREASNPAFKRLAGYIFNDDRPEGGIEMTAPVLMAPAAPGRTAMAFVMPERFTPSTLPTPKDPNIAIDTTPARRVAAIRFSGWADDEDLAEKEAELRAWLAAEGLTAAEKAEWAFYNPPWTLGPWRRNEVLIELPR